MCVFFGEGVCMWGGGGWEEFVCSVFVFFTSYVSHLLKINTLVN